MWWYLKCSVFLWFDRDLLNICNRRAELAVIVKNESKQPWAKIAILMLIVASILVLEIARAKDNKFNITCGSATYWLVTFAVFPLTILILLVQRKSLVREFQNKMRLAYEWQAGDVRWNATATIKYPLICACAGLFAGLFGIGGGIVKGPLMVEMGVQPSVAAASSATMVFFTSVAAGISFALYGLVPWEYVAVMGPVGIVSTALGLSMMKKLILKTGHPSYIILWYFFLRVCLCVCACCVCAFVNRTLFFCSIGAVVALSTVMMGIYGLVHYTKDNAVLQSSLTVQEKLCG